MLDDSHVTEYHEKSVRRSDEGAVLRASYGQFETCWLAQGTHVEGITAEIKARLEDPSHRARKIRGVWCCPRFMVGRTLVPRVEVKTQQIYRTLACTSVDKCQEVLLSMASNQDAAMERHGLNLASDIGQTPDAPTAIKDSDVVVRFAVEPLDYMFSDNGWRMI